jgi:hypothetical protein
MFLFACSIFVCLHPASAQGDSAKAIGKPTINGSIPGDSQGALNLLSELEGYSRSGSFEMTPTIYGGGQYNFLDNHATIYSFIYAAKPSFDTNQDAVVRNLLLPKSSSFTVSVGVRAYILGRSDTVPSLALVGDYSIANKDIPSKGGDSSYSKQSISTNNYSVSVQVVLSNEIALYGGAKLFTINDGPQYFTKYFGKEAGSFWNIELGGKFKYNIGKLDGVFVDLRFIPIKVGNLQDLLPQTLRTMFVFGIGYENIIK